MKTRACALALLSGCFFSRDAFADPAEPSPAKQTADPEVPPTTRARAQNATQSYGGIIAGTDAAIVLLGALGGGLTEGVLAVPALAAYAFAGPIIHGMHDNVPGALGSFLLRLVLPVASTATGAFVTYAAAGGGRGCRDFCGYGVLFGAGIGAVAGVVTTTVIDAALLTKLRPAPADGPRAVRWSPTVAPEQGGIKFGLGGTF
jgi:hypothetical protein